VKNLILTGARPKTTQFSS